MSDLEHIEELEQTDDSEVFQPEDDEKSPESIKQTIKVGDEELTQEQLIESHRRRQELEKDQNIAAYLQQQERDRQAQEQQQRRAYEQEQRAMAEAQARKVRLEREEEALVSELQAASTQGQSDVALRKLVRFQQEKVERAKAEMREETAYTIRQLLEGAAQQNQEQAHAEMAERVEFLGAKDVSDIHDMVEEVIEWRKQGYTRNDAIEKARYRKYVQSGAKPPQGTKAPIRLAEPGNPPIEESTADYDDKDLAKSGRAIARKLRQWG